MEIVNFFEKMAGRWFSQRTTHALSTQQSKAGKSNLEVDFLSAEASEVQQLCQTAAAGNSPLCGLKIQQDSTVEGDTKNISQTTLLVPLRAEESAEKSAEDRYNGTFVRSGKPGQPSQTGSYSLEEEVLTITTKTEEATSTERLWFINDNLRMRTGITELASGLRIASFCSEIRMGVKPPKS
ncbi:MAG: phycobiliprotein lyase [Cyanobacteria bacterium J06629_19]